MNGYEIVRKSKVMELIQTGTDFFVVDTEKKKVYSSLDMRLRELAEKIDSDNTFIVKKAEYL